ncbi:MAG: DUF4412 domain-containing protein [Acidobacteria bacterium]|nr:DUF4412 domain-containing protein [Acidobacteriota bacterium]
MTSFVSRLKPLLYLIFVALPLIGCSKTTTNSASGSSAGTPASSSSSSSESAGGGTFEGVITSKMSLSSQGMEIKYSIKGTRTRVETQLAAGGTQTGVMLMDLASGSQTMLLPQMKTYMTTNWNAEGGLKNLAEKMAEKTGNTSFKATATGKTETIAGHTCTHWILGDKQDMDVCLAKGLGYFGGGGQSGSVLDQLRNLALGDKAKAQFQDNPEFLKFVEGGAFPLKLATIENGQPRAIMEVTSVEQKPLDDSLFAIPADYHKMEIPGIPTGKK